MDRFTRQELIRGWDQERIAAGCVLVHGRDWLGAFTVWALASLGVGTVLWAGHPRRCTKGLADWLLADPCPLRGSAIYDYPFAVEYGPELSWVVGEASLSALVDCAESPSATVLCHEFAERRMVKRLTAAVSDGGSFGDSHRPCRGSEPQDPVIAMALSSLLADAVREFLCPLADGLLPEDGRLVFEVAQRNRPEFVVLVGVGGIGVYAATALAAMGYGLYLFDFDRVELSNLNRQGLFTPDDAREPAYKASAAHRALTRLFPRGDIRSCVCRVDSTTGKMLGTLTDRPVAILSAVDNAETRLLLQDIGRELGIPVIQGSTDTFAADCYSQTQASELLDNQMRGSLREAVSRESETTRRDSCTADPSYVVAGMMAGAMMAHQVRICWPSKVLAPWHWRSGSLPVQQGPVRQGTIADSFDFGQVTL